MKSGIGGTGSWDRGGECWGLIPWVGEVGDVGDASEMGEVGVLIVDARVGAVYDLGDAECRPSLWSGVAGDLVAMKSSKLPERTRAVFSFGDVEGLAFLSRFGEVGVLMAMK